MEQSVGKHPEMAEDNLRKQGEWSCIPEVKENYKISVVFLE